MEARSWKTDESFIDYFNDKLTLAEKVCTDTEKLVDRSSHLRYTEYRVAESSPDALFRKYGSTSKGVYKIHASKRRRQEKWPSGTRPEEVGDDHQLQQSGAASSTARDAQV